MASVRAGFVLGLDFSEEQDCPESNLITDDHAGKTGFSRSHLLQRGSRTPPEQSTPGSELWKYFELQIYPTKPSVDIPNLVRLSR
jgi:hypothetical protein